MNMTFYSTVCIYVTCCVMYTMYLEKGKVVHVQRDIVFSQEAFNLL